MTRRPWTALVGLTAAALALTACAGGGDTEAGGDTGGDGSKGALAMSFPSQDVTVWNSTLEYMRPIIEDAGYEFLTDDSGFDAQAQVNNWSAWLQRGDVKAIMGLPSQIDSFIPVTQQALDAGVPVVGYALTWEGVEYSFQLDIVGAGAAVGGAAAEWIDENFAGQGPVKVALMGNSDTDIGQALISGLEDGLAVSKEGVEVFVLETADRTTGYQTAQTQLIAHPDTYVWLGIGVDMPLGARQAIIDSGIAPNDPRFYVGAADGNDEAYELIASGDDMWREAFIWSPKDIAETTARMLIDAAEGRLSSSEVAKLTHVTKDNATQFISG